MTYTFQKQDKKTDHFHQSNNMNFSFSFASQVPSKTVKLLRVRIALFSIKIGKKQSKLTTTPYIIAIIDFYEKRYLSNRQLTIFKHCRLIDLLSDDRFQSPSRYYSEKYKSIPRLPPFSNSSFLESVFKVKDLKLSSNTKNSNFTRLHILKIT